MPDKTGSSRVDTPAVRGETAREEGSPRRWRWAWAPPVFFVLAAVVLAAADIRETFEPPWLQAAVKFLFIVGASFFSAALAFQGYRAGGSVPVLLLGCSMMLVGWANLFGSVLVSIGRLNEGITVSNMGTLFAGMSHLAGATTLTQSRSRPKTRRTRRIPAIAAFGLCFAAVAALTTVAWRNLLPAFITSAGTTSLRTVVLFVAVAEYLASALMLGTARDMTGAGFLRLYLLGLVQMGVGLAAAALANVGSPLSWTGRAAQCSGQLYILSGLLVLLRERRTEGLSAGRLLAASFRLLQSQSQYRNIIEELHEGVWLTDPEGATQYVNPCLERMIGYTREELFGRGILEFAEARDLVRGGFETSGNAVLRTGEAEVRFRGKNGSFLWARTTASPVRDGSGGFAGMLWLLHDLTPQKQAEETIRETEARLKLAVEAARIGMWYWNILTDEVVFTEQTNRLYGLGGAGRVTLDRVKSAIHPEDRPRMELALRDALRGAGVHELEHRVLGPDGSTRWLLLKGRTTAGDDGAPRLYTGVVMDITDSKRAQAQLEELNETLERRVRERTKEVGALADQLRALAVELGQVEQRERRRLAKVLHDHIQQLLAAARMRVELIKREKRNQAAVRTSVREIDSLLLEAMEASRSLAVELSPPSLHMAGLAGGIAWLVSRMAENNQFTVRFKDDGRSEPEAEDTRFFLFECVRELLFNAYKHSGVREASVSMTRTAEDEIAIEVSDEGKGFDPEATRRFTRETSSYGLFSIQQRLSHLSGRMEIEAAPGKGTRVVLHVPTRRPPSRSRPSDQ